MKRVITAFGTSMRIVLAITCNLVATLAAGQFRSVFDQEEWAPQTFYGGLAGGVNFSQVDGDQRGGFHKVGIQAGPMVYTRLLGSLFGAVELQFAQKGSKDRSIRNNQNTGAGVQEYDIKLNYVEIPVTFLLHSGRWMGGGGVSYGRLLSSKEEAWDNFPINLYPEIYYFRKDDWQWHLMLNYEFYPSWVLSMRYSYSFRTIRDPERIPPGFGGGESYAQFNNVYGFKLCYFLNRRPE